MSRRPLNAFLIMAIEEELGSRKYSSASTFGWSISGDGTDPSASSVSALASMALSTSALVTMDYYTFMIFCQMVDIA